MNLAQIRKEYRSRTLDETTAPADPVKLFLLWMKEAVESEAEEPTAVHLATVDARGRPSGRMVLLKGVENGGFVFYTNYESRKARELAQNPYAALTFFWPELERQVRIEGKVRRTSREESVKYFESRPRESRLAAHASPQSKPIADRAWLEKAYNQAEQRFPDHVPCPENWGGFVLIPERFEFWQGRENRMHDRLEYRNGQIVRLAP
ncbi:MAG: pyridoxamine 5'-phosphate oxidase [Bacteroidia bacterium]|nr:pyridoxamine 5'-phosphate oxidase [Bacteroidia bacterium]MDW8333913.1 pyridoxamine 5'-phosphate oxidase [Bacteroidia bacterium]